MQAELAADLDAAGAPAFWGQPPGWPFHLVAAIPASVLIWSASLPGGLFLPVLAATVTLGVLALVWLVRAAGCVASRTLRSSARWLAVAPLGAVLVVALATTDGPLEARWAVGRPAFERVAEQAPAAEDDQAIALPGFPRRVGAYRISRASQHGRAFVFYEESGAFLDDAGFAYLPEGTDDVPIGELVSLHTLGDDWYAFQSSW